MCEHLGVGSHHTATVAALYILCTGLEGVTSDTNDVIKLCNVQRK